MDMSLSQMGISPTGINTSQILYQMRYIEEQPIRNMESEISQIKQEKDAWRDVNSRMSKLDGLLDDLQGQETYNSMATSSSDKDVMTATADTDAISGSYDITVDQKAKAQRVVGDTRLAEANSSSSESIDNIAMQDGVTYQVADITDVTANGTTYSYGLTDGAGTVYAVSENGESFTALETAKTDALANTDIENNTGADYNFGYQLSTSDSVKMNGTVDGDEKNTLTDASLTFGGSSQINGTTIDTSSINTVAGFITEVNNQDTGVTASLVDSRLVLESNKTGADNAMTLTDDANTLLDQLGVYGDGTGNVNDYGTDGLEDTPDNDAEDGYQPAQDAQITVNGISGITSSDNSFDNAVEGVTFNIETAASAGDTATIDVNADTGKAYDAVKAMVEQYNSVVDFIDQKTSTTGEEENTEGKVLQGDGTANRIASRLRTTFLDSIPTGNDIEYMSQIGLEFDDADYNQLTIDKGKLEDAIKNNPDQVHEFFAPDASEDADYNYDGLATRLKDYTNGLIESDGIIPNREDMLGNQVDRLNEDIEDYQENVDMEIQRMKEQFTQMQTTVSSLQNQSSWLSSQLGSMGLSGGMLQ